MDKEIIKLYEELTRLSTYDETTKTYYVSKENYHILGLYNDNRRNKIKQYAVTIGVTFDFPNNNFPEIKGESLFDEYNNIKSIIDSLTNEEEINILEEKRIRIRNLIIEYNIDLIKAIINRKLNSTSLETINDNYQIEELYQIGYEYLLNYIDTHYLEKKDIEFYIKSLLIIKIKRELSSEIGISEHAVKELLKIRKKLLEKNYSIKELAISLDLEESRVEELLNLDNIINSIEYEQIDESNVLDNPLEDEVISKEQQIKLQKLLATLPIDSQKKLIDLFCGFNGEEVHTYRGVAAKFGVSEGTICHRRKAVLTKLTSPSITKYIKQIMNIDLSEEEKNISFENMKTVDKRILKQLEHFLLRQLDKDTLDLLTNGLSNKLKEVLYIFLGYQSKNNIYINNGSLYQRRKEQVIKYIRNKITEIYVINNKNEEITNYLDYLMYYYLNKPKTKTRTR